MGNADCGCTGRNAVLVINTAIQKNYRPIDIILMPKNDNFAYYTRMNVQFCVTHSIGPFFMKETKANDPNENEETKQLLSELITLTEFDKYIQTPELSVLEYEEYYTIGKVDTIKTLPIDRLKLHLLVNSSSVFRVPLYLSLMTHPYISYSKKHISIDNDEKTKHQIEVDLLRTFPKIAAMNEEKVMFNFRSLLYEIAGRDQKISYVQGMNFIGALCLLLSGNHLETALILFTKVLSLKSTLFKMPYKECFKQDFPLLMKYLGKITELVAKYHNSIYEKMVEYEVNDHTWMTKWILTLFLTQFEIEIALKFWDVMISQGLDSIMVIILTILELFKDELTLSESLTDFNKIIGHDIVMDKEKAELLIQKLIHNINNKTYEK